MIGCRYLKYDSKRRAEVCVITGKETHGNIVCDFDFETCPHYCEALKPLNEVNERSQQSEPIGSTDNRSQIKLVQTSIFGKDGEVPFEG